MRHIKELLGEFFLRLASRYNRGGLLYAVGELSGMLYDAQGKKKLIIPKQKRLITNTGLRDLGACMIGAASSRNAGDNAISDTTFYKLCNAWNVGTGTTAESYTQTDLVAKIFSSNQQADSLMFQIDTTNNRVSVVSIKNFNFTASYTITEVGVYSNVGGTSAGTRLFDRVLLSNPVNVTTGDILTLSYTFTLTRP